MADFVLWESRQAEKKSSCKNAAPTTVPHNAKPPKNLKIMRIPATTLKSDRQFTALQNATNAGYQRARQKFGAKRPLWLVTVLGHARLWHSVRCCGGSALLDVVLVCHCLRWVHADIGHAVARRHVRVLRHAWTRLLRWERVIRRFFR
jgi:hypothetical protein